MKNSLALLPRAFPYIHLLRTVSSDMNNFLKLIHHIECHCDVVVGACVFKSELYVLGVKPTHPFIPLWGVGDQQASALGETGTV